MAGWTGSRKISCGTGRQLGIGLLLVLGACTGPTPRYAPNDIAPPVEPPPGVEVPGSIEKRAEPLQAPATPEPGQVLQLTRDGAILTAVLNNRQVEVARFGPSIQQTFVPEARAAFDPVLLATTAYEHDDLSISSLNPSSAVGAAAPTATGLAGALQTEGQALTNVQSALGPFMGPTSSTFKTDTVSETGGVQTLLPTGTQVAISGNGGTGTSNIYNSTNLRGVSVNVTQPLLQGAGIGVNLVALRQAKNRAVQSDYVFKNTVLGIVQQVETAYWTLVLDLKIEKIRTFAVGLADEQLKRNEALLAVGKAIEGDVMTSRAEKAAREADLVDAGAGIREQNVLLVRLLNPNGADQWRLSFDPTDPPNVVPVAVDKDASQKLAMQYRPELAQAKLDIANFDLDLFKARNNVLPQLNLVGSYGKTVGNGMAASPLFPPFLAPSSSGLRASSDLDSYRIGAQFQYPIMNRAAHARYRRAQLTDEQGERQLANLEQSISSDVRRAVDEFQRQRDRVEATKQEVVSRQEEYRVAQGRFEVGKTTNLDLLLVQRDLIQSEVDAATAEVQYIQALTALYATEGTLLDRRGVSLELAKNTGAAQATSERQQTEKPK